MATPCIKSFNGVPLTGRETLIAREAFRGGLIRGAAREFVDTEDDMGRLEAAVRKEFPLPKVRRPRVVPDPEAADYFWSVQSGVLVVRPPGFDKFFHLGTSFDLPICPARVRALNDLLEHPTEDVEADGSESGG